MFSDSAILNFREHKKLYITNKVVNNVDYPTRMSQFSWNNLKRPFFCLAPMANVTDAAFRRMFVQHGKPDVIWTEFVSADGLMSRGQRKLLNDLKYDESERPIIAQLFSANPKKMESAAKLIRELSFDGLDINMGCPARDIESTGSGASLIKNHSLAAEIIEAGKQGAFPLPVSVKTRIGYSENELDTWLPVLVKSGVAAITIHARTREEMSKVPARWEEVARAVKIAEKIMGDARPIIIGNGDVKTIEEARERTIQTQCDGVMIGRGAFGTPWFFSSRTRPNPKEVAAILTEHIALFDKLLGKIKPFEVMKKHFKAYITAFEGAAELRTKLMETKTAKEATDLLELFTHLP